MQIFYNKHFKSNFVFDTMVWFGIKLSPLLKKPSENVAIEIQNYVLISTEMNTALKNVLKQDSKLQLKMASYNNNTEYILDNNDARSCNVIFICH